MKKLPTRGWDWLSILLLGMLMTTASARLWITDWTPHLGLAQVAALLGSALGLTLGYSLFKRGVGIIAAGYTLVMLPCLWLSAITSKESALQRLASLGGRLSAAFTQIASRQPVDDFIFFVTLMTALFWFIALFSGYQLARHGNILAAILPGGLGIVIIELYDVLEPERILYLGTYLLVSLILLGRHNLLKNDAFWHEKSIATSSDISMDISTGVVVASFVLLIGIWMLPLNGVTFAPVEHAWRNFDARFEPVRAWFRDALAAVENYIPSGGGTGFGAEMSLGRTAAEGDTVIFNVEAPGGIVERYYWRARVYDTYVNGRWSNGDTRNHPYLPDNDALFVPLDKINDLVKLVFIIGQPQRTLLTLNDPLWISRAGTATYGETGTTVTDLITFRAEDIVRVGERYEVESAVRSPNILQLRRAGTDYPGWLKERYLQLPSGFPNKIGQLAAEITADAETPYDKTVAITNYLRANITYTNRITSDDPRGGDPIAWMLFNSREGFCNYYATAEVLMLRALGIPARLAVGYAEGEKIGMEYRVRNRDSHAWPEVYFPGLGWVEFEPTTAQPSLARPSGEISPARPVGASQPTQPVDDGAGREPIEDENPLPIATDSQLIQRLMRWVIILIVGGLITGYLIYLNRREPLRLRIPRALAKLFARFHWGTPRWLQDWLRWTEQTPAERAFETINLCLRLLGNPQPVHATPIERAAALSTLLPDAAAAIEQLTEEHIRALFSPAAPAPNNAWRAALSIYLFTARHYFRTAR
jgi:transglutaminase-like putative cysteine protease